MAKTAVGQHELSFIEFLRGFMEYASSRGQKSFPPFEDRLWHEFLYLLKSEYERQYPQLSCIGAFDWNGGVYPKCRAFNVEMFNLRSECYSKTAGGRVLLEKKTPTIVSPLFLYYPYIARKAVEVASTFPGFFEK